MRKNSTTEKPRNNLKYYLIALPFFIFFALAHHTRQNIYSRTKTKAKLKPAKASSSLNSQKNNMRSLANEISQNKPNDGIPALHSKNQTEKLSENAQAIEKKCSGQKITLENKKIYKDVTLGSENTCEVTLPSLSYIKIIGNVKIIAHKISLLGVINGNANESGNKNAANLEIIALKSLEANGTIELRGLSDDKASLSKGGLLKATAPKIYLSALINLQGSKNENNGSSSFSCLGTDCTINEHNIIYSKNKASEISNTQHAREIIQLAENIKELKSKLKSFNNKQVSETLNFSLLQKVKLLKQRRAHLNEKLSLHINKEIESEAIKNGISPNTFMSKVFGAQYFQRKAFSYEPHKSSTEETLIKDLELEILSQLLKKNKNFDLYSWGLEADASFELEEKIHQIQTKAIEVYGT